MAKLLLSADVKSLGLIGDVVEVAEGYARNYLIPQGLAVEPTPSNIQRIEEEKKIVEARRAAELEEKKRLAEAMNGVEVTIESRCNPQGHLFGSVGPKEIADALAEEGYNVEPEMVKLDEHFKQVDKYTVTVRFAEEVTSEVIVWVTPEKGQVLEIEEEEDTEGDDESVEPSEVDEGDVEDMDQQ